MFKSILDYYESLNLMHPHLRYSLEKRVNYLQSQQESTIQKMREVVGKYHYENIPQLFDNLENVYRIEFFKGVDDFTIRVIIDDVLEDNELGYIFKDQGFENFNEIKITDEIIQEWKRLAEKEKRKIEKIPYEKNLYPDENKDYFTRTLRFHFNDSLTYSWLAYCWQEAGGCQIGMNAGMTENNSCREFSFNDLTFDNSSEFYKKKPYGDFIQSSFNRKLSFEEIYIRGFFGIFPQKDSINTELYHVRGDDFFEIRNYKNEVTIIEGKTQDKLKSSFQNLSRFFDETFFDKQGNDLKKCLLQLSKQKINEGWILKFKPNEKYN